MHRRNQDYDCNFSGVVKNCVLKDVGEIEFANVIRNGELVKTGDVQ